MSLATTPRTFVAGETVTAAMLNVEIRDNMTALGASGVMGTPTATSTDGTVTSGTTETRDAVLGNYTFTAVAGRRYRAVMDGLRVNTTVAGDLVRVFIRNGGASTPTAGSTQIATSQISMTVAGGTGQTSLAIAGTFVPGAGTVTLGAFTVRANGTGVETPYGVRELYAVDLGPS